MGMVTERDHLSHFGVGRSRRAVPPAECPRRIARGMDLKPPIFIVGCGHSGTSLVLAILGAHSKIYAVPYESKFGFKSDEAAKALFAEFDAKTVSAGKQRWVEKTPRHVH